MSDYNNQQSQYPETMMVQDDEVLSEKDFYVMLGSEEGVYEYGMPDFKEFEDLFGTHGFSERNGFRMPDFSERNGFGTHGFSERNGFGTHGFSERNGFRMPDFKEVEEDNTRMALYDIPKTEEGTQEVPKKDNEQSSGSVYFLMGLIVGGATVLGIKEYFSFLKKNSNK